MRMVLAGILAACSVAPLHAQAADSLPDGVTREMIAAGDRLFNRGICTACHGQNGRGMANMGPNLGDAEWLHSDGSYEAIVEQINTGVTAAQSRSRIVMPPRGGGRFSDDEVRALAAYVWSLRLGRRN